MQESIVFCITCTMSSYRKFTFAISSPDEFLVLWGLQTAYRSDAVSIFPEAAHFAAALGHAAARLAQLLAAEDATRHHLPVFSPASHHGYTSHHLTNYHPHRGRVKGGSGPVPNRPRTVMSFAQIRWETCSGLSGGGWVEIRQVTVGPMQLKSL